MIESCCDQVKRGKAHGFDGLTAQLYVVLSLLFHTLYVYDTVQDAFRVGIAIPFVNKVDGDKTTPDN